MWLWLTGSNIINMLMTCISTCQSSLDWRLRLRQWYTASTDQENRHIFGYWFQNIGLHVTCDRLLKTSLLQRVRSRLKKQKPSASLHWSGTVYHWHWDIAIQLKLFVNIQRHTYTPNILLTKRVTIHLSAPTNSSIHSYIWGIINYMYLLCCLVGRSCYWQRRTTYTTHEGRIGSVNRYFRSETWIEWTNNHHHGDKRPDWACQISRQSDVCLKFTSFIFWYYGYITW